MKIQWNLSYLCLHSECTAVSGSMVNKLNALDFLEIAVYKCINKDIGVSGVSSISKIISIVLPITQKSHKNNYFVNFKVDRKVLSLVLISADWFRLKLETMISFGNYRYP